MGVAVAVEVTGANTLTSQYPYAPSTLTRAQTLVYSCTYTCVPLGSVPMRLLPTESEYA